MQNRFTLLTKQIFFLSLLLLLMSCQKEDLAKEQNAQPLNSFSMQLNGRSWQPSQIGEDECMRTYHGAWSEVTQNGVKKPYYTISAYRDSKALATAQSENGLRLQITNVQKTGTYNLTGSYQQSFDSYAVFSVRKPDGTYSRYINKVNKPSFVVEVSEFIPISGSSVTGIKGAFYGTLYNESNSLDSLTFTRGAFTLKKVNWYNFNQCAQ